MRYFLKKNLEQNKFGKNYILCWFPGEENSKPLQDSCLKNPMDRLAWQATVHGVARVGHDLATKATTTYYVNVFNSLKNSEAIKHA